MEEKRMPKVKAPMEGVKLAPEQVTFLKERMAHLVERNLSWSIKPDDYATLFSYLAVQKITYLYDEPFNDVHQGGRT